MSRLITLFVICAVVGLWCPGANSDAPPDGLAGPTILRCEYLVGPLGIDQAAPRLSWEPVDTRRDAVQTAYRILVAGDPAKLNADVGDLWDTGKVASDESINVVYAGQPLRSRMRVWWKVRVWDKDGQPSPWSSVALWSMGLCESADWHAKWIGDTTPPPETKDVEPLVPPMLHQSVDTWG